MFTVVSVGTCSCGLQVVKVRAPNVRGPRNMLRRVLPGFGKRSGIWLHMDAKGRIINSPRGKHSVSDIKRMDSALVEAMKEQLSPPPEAEGE